MTYLVNISLEFPNLSDRLCILNTPHKVDTRRLYVEWPINDIKLV